MTKPPIIIVVAAIVMTMISSSIISMTHAQQPQISGPSLEQLLAYNTAELATSTLNLKFHGYCQVHGNSSSPAFNATLNMVMFNGTSPHMHTITDFKMTGSPIKKGITTTYNGTATISFRPGFLLPVPFVTNVPVSIKLMGPSAMSMRIDPIKTRDHFGNTPIYGVQQGMPMMQMTSMK
jgi:hypothetical protein